jgi:nucleoside-diphosphate-sugar epimerase
MRALVTGASGFIGGALAERLRDESVDLWLPTRAELDLERADSIERALEGRGIDVVVHAAASRARSAPDPSRFVAETAINVLAAARLFDAARRAGVRAIVHLSTLSVFRPVALGKLVDETTAMVEAPGHPYGLTKKWSEEIAISMRASFDGVAIVRPGMAYGRDQSPGSGMGRLVAAVASRRPYELAPPDGHTYSPVHIDDVVDVLARLVAKPANVAVNVVGIDARSERTIVSDLARLLGVDTAFETTAETAVSMAASPAFTDALFPDRTRTSWQIGSTLAFGRG